MRKKYYAAANTEKGFVSLFDEIFSEKKFSSLYIIKGGPGTGKSTFMYGIASAAEEKGFEAEYYYCSADTDSLDGIIIPALSVAIIDGTAPHTMDPKYPGSIGKIINLGENFDIKKLEENREKIVYLTDKCSSYYASAVKFLSACGSIMRSELDISEKAFNNLKAAKAAKRLLSEYSPSGKGDYSEKYISAIGVRGEKHMDVNEWGKKTVVITGKYGFNTLFAGVIAKTATELGFSVTRFPNVLLKERTEAVYISEADTVFIVGEEGEETINAMRFADREKISESRGKLRFAEKCIASLMEGALEELYKMGETHDELERFYISAMDFQGNDDIENKIKKEIFGS